MSPGSWLVPLTVASSGLLVLALLPAAYLGFLAVLGGRHPGRRVPTTTPTFSFLVPAHNEETGIAATVASLKAVDWPAAHTRIIVVADNCQDQTAAVARAAGAEVLERQHDTLKGKGYALELGFNWILNHTNADAVVVVDADTVVENHLLRSFASCIEDGAMAMQAEYQVNNVHASWRTELMTVALAMFHTLRGNARERLRLSSGLRGNGMCFTRACLQQVPPQAYGLVEDVEHGIALGRAGIRVVGVVDARVLGEMVSGGAASESQRRRWEDGRKKLKAEVLPGVIADGLRRRDPVLLDLAADLLVPPLATIAVLVVAGLTIEAVRVGVVGRVDALSGAALLPALLLGLYVLRGLQLSRLGLRAVVVLAKAPVYVLWKIGLKLRGKKAEGWVRTAREAEAKKPE